jgi:DNA-binding PadR family transcriptional regulator
MVSSGVSVRHFILGLLNQQPMTGYDVKRFLKSLGWLIDSPSFGNIYSTLHGLLEDGLVSVEVIPNDTKPPRKVYNITHAGEDVLREWVGGPVGDNVSLRTFLMRLIVAGSFLPDRLIPQLEQRRQQVSRFLDDLSEPDGMRSSPVDSGGMALDFGLTLAEAELRWLEDALERLTRQPLAVEGGAGS